jgi:tRNA nucleotidyltransferase/poly(A) polymerase
VVGGFVRNLLMKRESRDIDIVCENIASAREFADRVKGNYFTLGAGILHRVQKNGSRWDFTQLKEDIEKDLARRDFTCDAMALDIKNISRKDLKEYVIDPSGGLKDIENNLLRPVSKKIFSDDPVRIIRAFRLRQELGFKFSKDLPGMISGSLHLLKDAKPERIREELEKLFFIADAGLVREMSEKEIFNAIYHAGEAGQPAFLRNDFVFMLAAVWKDAGIGRRLGISNKEKKLLKEFLSRDRDIFKTWLSWGKEAEKIFKARYSITGDKDFLNILQQNTENLNAPKKPVLSGEKIMKVLNLSPSPEVGKIIKKLLKAQFEGKIRNEEQAREFIKKG